MTDISGKIRDAYSNEPRGEARAYIGASGVGQSCEASIAFSFRGYPDTPPSEQLKRIFRDGHRIEYLVVKDMAKGGVHVMEKDPMTGKQWRYTAYGGHAIGHADGLTEIDDKVVGVEIKSMNDNKFNEFAKKGVKVSHANYYDQMQFMMGMSGIERFVLVAYNKNNSAYHHEYVDFDVFRFESLNLKVERVLSNMAAKCSIDESDWRCRGCFKVDACWRGELPKERSVRTCGRSTGNHDGTFACETCGGDVCSSWMPYTPLDKK